MTTTNGRTVPGETEELVRQVRDRYGRIARGADSCCDSATGIKASDEETARRIGYRETELEAVPDGTNLGLGCGAPLQDLALQPGETVLDLGSGAGLDALLAASLVGEDGKVIGVDMTAEMLERARDNARQAGHPNVEFREGRLEELPVDDGSVDAVMSNCVINLVPDKPRVFREVARVLKPGGRMVISDIVLDAPLPPAIADDLLAYVGCISGAMEREPYFAGVTAAGLTGVEILRDVDFLGAGSCDLPADLRDTVERSGIALEDLQGKVRSVTYRATRS